MRCAKLKQVFLHVDVCLCRGYCWESYRERRPVGWMVRCYAHDKIQTKLACGIQTQQLMECVFALCVTKDIWENKSL